MPQGLEPLPEGSAVTPEGFECAGVACGLKATGDLDLGILRSVRRAASAVVDTVSVLPAAPVVHTRSLARERLQAVLVTSGCANAATGEGGLEDARELGARAAAALGLGAEEVAVSSTGVIGERMNMPRALEGIEAAAAVLGPDEGLRFARAICTTDRWTKTWAARLDLSAGPALIGGTAKGGGMISPRMATMLAYVTTDAAVPADALARLTAVAAERSFNRISVDGQMSPSDTLVVMANGEGAPVQGADLDRFGRALTAICRFLALQMVKDGEGAEHAVRLVVDGAVDQAEAEAVARAIANSPLVKAAVYGRDPNWGRIVQSVGHALAGRGGPQPRLSLAFDGLGAGDPGLADVMAREEYELAVRLGRGEAGAEMWFCDLTHAYVTLNAEYHT
jgi:glutamate N-acetyltransferase/amino-acid N-acetyltransferase